MLEAIFQKVAGVIAEYKKIPVEQITLDTTFEELGMDSLDGLSVVFELEEAFDVMIPDDAAKTIQNVRQIVESLEKLGVVV
jgi:acyl carrier protein